VLVAVELILDVLIFFENLSVSGKLKLLKLLALELFGVVLGLFDSGLDDMLDVLIFVSEPLVLELLHLYPFFKVF
jgi:hypothetical protein